MAYASALLLVLSCLPAACSKGHGPANVPVADLLRSFQDAERRPLHATFELKEHTFAGTPRASLVVPAESRVTWKLFVPHRGHLRMFIALSDDASAASVAVRVGVSDGRIYNTLAEQTISSADTAAHGWIPIDVDVSTYAGRKWSLFYRPDGRKWHLIIGTHVLAGRVSNVYLGAPALMTDVEGAREYLRRLTATSASRAADASPGR